MEPRVGLISEQTVLVGYLPLKWVKCFKYVGINFNIKRSVEMDCTQKHKFYSSCNSIFQRRGTVPKPVRLKLVKSFLSTHADLYYPCTILVKICFPSTV